MTHQIFVETTASDAGALLSPCSLRLLQWRTVTIRLVGKLLFMQITYILPTRSYKTSWSRLPHFWLCVSIRNLSQLQPNVHFFLDSTTKTTTVSTEWFSLPALKCHLQPQTKLQLLLPQTSPPALSLFPLLEAKTLQKWSPSAATCSSAPLWHWTIHLSLRLLASQFPRQWALRARL